jgi:hypothetical protein
VEEEIVMGEEMVSVVAVEPLENHLLRVELSDGRKGIFDVTPYLNTDFFKELKDMRYFRRVFIAYDTVTWPHEQDIAPETIELGLQPEPSPEKMSPKVVCGELSTNPILTFQAKSGHFH